MSLVCSISGTAPEEPVVSKTGYIFERRHVVKHLEVHGTCPITQEPLTVEDLLPVKVKGKAVKPRVATAASIPGLLSLMQNEWDSVMAETFTLKTHLETVRSQLSHTLYQHDAACRCIARLIRDRDAARAQVAELQERVAPGRGATTGGEGVEPGISDELISRLQKTEVALRTGRKKRTASAVTASVDDVGSFQEAGSYPLHQSTSPGILTVDVDTSGESNSIATGGVDCNVCVFNIDRKKTVGKLVGHMKRVNTVLMHPELKCVLSGSDDKTIRVWKAQDDILDSTDASAAYCCSHIIRTLTGEVIDAALHPLNEYCVSVAKGRSWALHDIVVGRTLRTVRGIPCEYHCIQLHPDGLLLGGGGSDNTVHMWDLRESSELKTKIDGHTGPVNSLAFSQNGYYLATGSSDGTVRLWDLRKKDSMGFQTIELPEDKKPKKGAPAPAPVQSVQFDYSGNYIAIGVGCSAHIYNFETRTSATRTVSLSGHEDTVTCAKFGSRAEFLVTASMDRTVKYWEPATSSEPPAKAAKSSSQSSSSSLSDKEKDRDSRSDR